MHLKSIELKGFKSFPERTVLRFDPGVSVVVGPNGSGKSNITDAVLWALGEQSPLAVRGQSMQDVIFGGGRGVQARSEAMVELVLDNSDGIVDLPAAELSIVRRLNRAGEGEYRLNGARCRLVDVLEVLSDTGMGKEAHSVISQGRVEAIVTSKPRDRRLLIEEAAGLGKHRKRRRRAQLKLERTQENLDRALDIEREARARLRPLKRPAEAAELHERLERQSLEARWELARDALRSRTAALSAAEVEAAAVRARRTEVDGSLAQVAARRARAEHELATRASRHEEWARRAFAARSARERLALRAAGAGGILRDLGERIERRGGELRALRAESSAAGPRVGERIAELEEELRLLDSERAARLEREIAELTAAQAECAARVAAASAERERRAAACAAGDMRVREAREQRRACERAVEAARRESARVGAELAAVNQFLRSHAATDRGEALDGFLAVRPGFELALAAALGGRLGAAVVADRRAGESLLDAAGRDGGVVLVQQGGPAGARPTEPPSAGALRLLELITPAPAIAALAERLLADAWVVNDLADVSLDFGGLAVTRSGRVWTRGELRQEAAGGRERALEQRNRREELSAAAGDAAAAEHDARADGDRAAAAVLDCETAREEAEVALRTADREYAEAVEHERRARWLIEERRAAPDQGEVAVRRAQLAGELAAERRAVERAERERRAREQRTALLESQVARDRALVPQAERLLAVLAHAAESVAAHVADTEASLDADRQAGEGVSAELRACAGQEAGLQTELRALAESVTAAEVRAQHARDQCAEARGEATGLAERLGLEATPAEAELDPAQRSTLHDRVERLARRREQLGPVNPLAAEEYREAMERVEELETMREDLETALRELRALIRDTDRTIAETFEQTFTAAARNFEELVGDVFPGGRGRLRLVREDAGPRPVLGGAQVDGGAAASEEAADGEEAAEHTPEDELLGVEIEITPAGKSMKRLSLLSGGEKSMTALAFMFAVFLARPCPFYILDEVEAALDDLNIDRFLKLLRRHSSRAQFIVVTHQKRTMEAADVLYGVSMGNDGVSKIVSRRLAAGDAGAGAGEETLAGAA
ncbi:MAG: hypothetical protein NVSMB51_05850 [Solirubrobacteraceae bacterium]